MRAGDLRFLGLLAVALTLVGLQVRRDLARERTDPGIRRGAAPGTARPPREREVHARSRKVDRDALRRLTERGELSEREAAYWGAEP
ncbi:MAG: hypothetical protein A2X36_11500 [Elusimicrobia bacterium GWA2_69_24]|nr:MAG: hypothetical protein A2X36_11500 [Elusimicrobia bacterium GWA2_69_24]HBL18913.1 hypothetical protein [Elusimicrobiota bacterium]